MSFSGTTDIPALDPVHDNRHRLNQEALARESLAYMIEIPEENIGGFLYTWVNGESKAGAALCLFGPGIGDEPIFEFCDGIDVPREMDFFDWRVQGLHMQHGEPLQQASLYFKGEKASIDYHFQATQPAYAYSTHPKGCPQWIAHNRFEQQGRFHGSLRIGERTINFDTLTQRDHSWGTREWGINQHWKWLHAQAGDNLGVHFWQMESVGQTRLYGYVFKDGHISAVANIEVDFVSADRLEQKSLSAIITDECGRTTRVNAEAFAVFPFAVDPMITLYESPLKLTIDDTPGQGWLEVLWTNSLLDYMKNRAA